MGNEKDSRKRKYCWNNATKQKSVEPGISGLLITCDSHEKQAIAEAYNIIDYIMENSRVEDVTEKKPDDEGEEEEDVADSLKRICDEARDNKEKVRRCKQRPTGVKNCLFITVRDADVVDLAEKMVTYAQAERQCRYLQRVLPVEDTADVNLKKLNDMVLKCVSRHLKARDDGSFPSHAMEFKARNNDSIKKTDVLEMLGDAVSAVAPTSRVDLNNADVTFMVQLVRKTMMVGGMPNYYAKRKYSMRPKEEKRDDVNAEKTNSLNEPVENKEEAGTDEHQASLTSST